MTPHETIHTLHTMSKFGGNFERHLAATCIVADPNNRSRLLKAFPEIEHKFGPNAQWYSEELG